MKTNRIRLTEAQLKQMVSEAVKNVLMESEGYDSLKQAYGEQGDEEYDKHLKKVGLRNGFNRTPEQRRKMDNRKKENKQNLDPLRVKQSRLSEQRLYSMISESVKKVLKEIEEPNSWIEHDNGIAFYDKNGNEISGYDYDGTGYYDDTEAGSARRGEQHQAWNFGHPYDSVEDEFEYNDYSGNDPLTRSYYFRHSDEDSRWERPHQLIMNDDEYWNDGKGNKDKELERILKAADKRPLIRKKR